MKSILPIVALVLLCSCHLDRSARPPAEPLTTPELNLADGVDRQEAQELAWRYFGEFHGACGAVTLTRETTAAWVFATAVGYGAVPGTDIVVYKDGSKITQAGFPDLVYSGGKWTYRGKNFFGDESRG